MSNNHNRIPGSDVPDDIRAWEQQQKTLPEEDKAGAAGKAKANTKEDRPKADDDR